MPESVILMNTVQFPRKWHHFKLVPRRARHSGCTPLPESAGERTNSRSSTDYVRSRSPRVVEVLCVVEVSTCIPVLYCTIMCVDKEAYPFIRRLLRLLLCPGLDRRLKPIQPSRYSRFLFMTMVVSAPRCRDIHARRSLCYSRGSDCVDRWSCASRRLYVRT